jgi:hypothetical protein
MNRKAFIMSLYIVAQVIVLKRWYAAGNTGMPKPSLITGPCYLYGVLAITSDFLQGLPIVLAAGFTVGLYFTVKSPQVNAQTTGKQTTPSKTSTHSRMVQTTKVK